MSRRKFSALSLLEGFRGIPSGDLFLKTRDGKAVRVVSRRGFNLVGAVVSFPPDEIVLPCRIELRILEPLPEVVRQVQALCERAARTGQHVSPHEILHVIDAGEALSPEPSPTD